MQITKISNQNSLINFGAISLQRSAQRNIQKQLNSTWQNFSLPNKPIKKVLNGPQGHPYTGRSIINNNPAENEGFLGNLKKLKKVIFDGDDKFSDTVKYAGETAKKCLTELIDIIL